MAAVDTGEDREVAGEEQRVVRLAADMETTEWARRGRLVGSLSCDCRSHRRQLLAHRRLLLSRRSRFIVHVIALVRARVGTGRARCALISRRRER